VAAAEELTVEHKYTTEKENRSCAWLWRLARAVLCWLVSKILRIMAL
jgi:hypothetical protein